MTRSLFLSSTLVVALTTACSRSSSPPSPASPVAPSSTDPVSLSLSGKLDSYGNPLARVANRSGKPIAEISCDLTLLLDGKKRSLSGRINPEPQDEEAAILFAVAPGIELAEVATKSTIEIDQVDFNDGSHWYPKRPTGPAGTGPLVVEATDLVERSSSGQEFPVYRLTNLEARAIRSFDFRLHDGDGDGGQSTMHLQPGQTRRYSFGMKGTAAISKVTFETGGDWVATK